MEELLEEFIKECSAYTKTGAVANYIPELTKADPDMLISVLFWPIEGECQTETKG